MLHSMRPYLIELLLLIELLGQRLSQIEAYAWLKSAINQFKELTACKLLPVIEIKSSYQRWRCIPLMRKLV